MSPEQDEPNLDTCMTIASVRKIDRVTFGGASYGCPEERDVGGQEERGPDQVPNVRQVDMSRVRSHQEARANPLDVLVTNYLMLEYMLIEPQDAPFFRHDLSVVVLDKMHLCSWTLSPEIALLLRRVLLRCTLRHEVVT